MKKSILFALPLSLLSLIAGVATIVLAEFGAPAWVFVLLLGWLLTLGLPSLGGMLLAVHLWEGLGLQGFLVSAGLFAMVFQCAAVWLVRQGIGRLRVGRAA